MPVEITQSGAVGFIGSDGVNLFRMMTILRGLKMEAKGLKMTRGMSCLAIAKREFGLKGNREKVLAQFEVLVEQARASVAVIDKTNEGGAK